MKQILLLIMAVLMVTGCNKEERRPELMIESSAAIYLSQDSTHSYKTRTGDENHIFITKARRKDNFVVWEKETVRPDPIKFEIGYGEYKTIEYQYASTWVLFDSNQLIFTLWRGQDSQNYGTVCIGVYSINGDYIKNIHIAYPNIFKSLVRWKDDNIIIVKKEGYIILDSKGDLIESKDDIELQGWGTPYSILERKYICHEGHFIYICDLDYGTKEIDLLKYITEKYKENTNIPKIEIGKVLVLNDIIQASVSITFYNGNKKDDIISINLLSGEIIQE